MSNLNKKNFFPYLIINNETDKFDQLIQDHKVTHKHNIK